MQKKMNSIDNLYETFMSINRGNEKKWSKSFFLSLIKHKDTICLFTKPKPKGYLIARVIQDEIEIITLLIDVSYRRKGLAKNLLEDLKKIAFKKKVLKIILEVSISNKNAICLYEKMGFIEVAVRRNYYVNKKKKVDAKVMCFKLYA